MPRIWGKSNEKEEWVEPYSSFVYLKGRFLPNMDKE